MKLVFVIALTIATGEAAAQSRSPFQYVVSMMEAQGCTATESEMFEAIFAAGGGVSDAQAIIVNMANAGDLIWNGVDGYTLKNTGNCP